MVDFGEAMLDPVLSVVDGKVRGDGNAPRAGLDAALAILAHSKA